MCGIVGYAGGKQAAPILLDGLEKLEYRGYDSAGICVQSDQGFAVEKTKGRLEALREKTADGKRIKGTVGIGHTRWATHGAPSDINSHPHLSDSGKIAVVHNGIIENEAKLRQWLEKHGILFQSETDSEVVAELIGYYYAQYRDFRYAVRHAVSRLEGSFALGILCTDEPGRIIAVKKDSPLIFGFGEGENYIASDVPAILKYTRQVVYLEDGDMAEFNSTGVTFYDGAGDITEKKPETVTWEPSSAQRGGYDHFMLKEIMEQPKAVRDTLSAYTHGGRVEFENAGLTAAYLRAMKRIYIVACGSAYYAAVLGKYTLEKACRICVEAVLASEFRYSDPVVDENTLVIAISQSGETADTLAALKEAKGRGVRTLAIVNVIGSSIAKAADGVIYTRAGPEIAVATTKAFSAQLVAMYLLSLYMADKTQSISTESYQSAVVALERLPEAMESVLGKENLKQLQYLASRYCGRHNAFYIGRNLDSCICMEGSLKLKEVAYLHSEAYPAGELKHGPISLIEEETLVVALATVDDLFDKTMANIKEVKARGADVLCVTTESRKEAAGKIADHVLTIPNVHQQVRPSLSVIPLQLFAYYVALQRGCDVDKPRNLAKSVTVE